MTVSILKELLRHFCAAVDLDAPCGSIAARVAR
jgi:hypothetical protein